MPRKKRHLINLFCDGESQVISIPPEFELNGEKALIYRDGDRLVIEPSRQGRLLELLASLSPLEEDFPNIDDDLYL